MNITLREFMREFSKKGQSLEGWGLKFYHINLLVTEAPDNGDIGIIQVDGGFACTLTPERWWVIGVKPKFMRYDRNTLLVR